VRKLVSGNDSENMILNTDSPFRTLRGCSFTTPSSGVRSASCLFYEPKGRYSFFGFRVARTLPIVPSYPLTASRPKGSR
jgi:formylglycine-generating enzyme required for sulfatase activity